MFRNKLTKNLIIFVIAVIIIHNVPASWFGDAPYNHNHNLQEPATTMMEGAWVFNLSLLMIIITIVVLIGYLMFAIMTNFIEFFHSSQEAHSNSFTHADSLEIIWTSTPTLILVTLAAPSFTLLYSLDEITNPTVTFKIFGHQWYWSYENSDFKVCCKNKTKTLKYTCYMLPDEILYDRSPGFFRLLETNKRVALPAKTHIRLLITAVDVLHSWTVPSFGLKIDACPGRLNQTNLYIKRAGLFFGQCSEICGVNHGFMPIVVIAAPINQYELNIINYL